MKTATPFCVFSPPVKEAEGSRQSLSGQLGVVGRGEASAQVLEDVKRQTAHQRDDEHLPQERHRGDEVDVCRGGRRGKDQHEGVTYRHKHFSASALSFESSDSHLGALQAVNKKHHVARER